MNVAAVRSRTNRTLGILVLWGASYIAARLTLDVDLNLGPASVRLGLALLPLVPTVLALRAIAAGIREADELERRVHLEALGIAYPLAILLLMTLGLLELAIGLDPKDWSYRHVWIYLPLFYFVGLAIAWRRYK